MKTAGGQPTPANLQKKLYEKPPDIPPHPQGLPQPPPQLAPSVPRGIDGVVQFLQPPLMTDADINAAIGLLRSRGFSVTHPEASEWIAPIDLWRTTAGAGSLAQFHDRLNHPRCPAYPRHVGATGRTTTLRPTVELLAFLSQPSQPGKRLK